MSIFSKQGLDLLSQKYYYKNETTPEDLFFRVSKAYQENEEHGSRILTYLRRHWFMPSTPILANAGTERGMPISCFLVEVGDNSASICNSFSEVAWLAINGGGVAINTSNIRSTGEKISSGGITSGVQPFHRIYDALSAGIAQGGSLRRGSTALYMHIEHPEILNFIQMRKSTGGDVRSKNFDSHHGVIITNKFMDAVTTKQLWYLKSPKDGSIIKEVDAFELWCSILEIRAETGEPYLFFDDNVRDGRVSTYRRSNREVTMSNLCTEICLHTSEDETAVCCLSSLNLEYFDEWKDNQIFYYDVMLFMKNVMNSFIFEAERINPQANYSYSKAIKTAKYERSIGIGVMGYHYYLQKHNIPFDSELANQKNQQIFMIIKVNLDERNRTLAQHYSPAPLCKETGELKYFTNVTAIAPTASISIIAGQTSLGIEPIGNIYDSKTNGTRDIIKNRYLEKLIKEKELNEEEIWNKIISNRGSIQSLSEFTSFEKRVFKTPFEIDQKMIIKQASTRQPFIDQAQSINLFINANISKQELYDIHKLAWTEKLKTLYYLRTQAVAEKEFIGQNLCTSKEECEACQ